MAATSPADLAHDPRALAARLAELEPAAAADRAAIRVVHAPGRVNLIGEHTDYNEGFVLPVGIQLGIAIALVPTDDRRVEVTLAATGERAAFDLDAIGPKTGSWIDYIAGMAWALADAGVATRGFRGVLASDLPQGSGLSSSAALELASSLALVGGALPPLDRMTLAQTAQRAENRYVGVNCGLMDQFASAFGEEGSALLLDCRTLEHRAVRLPLDDVALVVCHSGSPRRLETSAYNERRSQCEAAVAVIAERDPSVTALRDVTPAMLESPATGWTRSCSRGRSTSSTRTSACSRRSTRSPPGTSTRSAACSTRARRRCATCSGSAARSSTRSSTSRPASPASTAPASPGPASGAAR